jgi:hypothetical protein
MTFTIESMSDDALKTITKSTNKTLAEKAKAILAKRVCVVEQPGQRTDLPKLNNTMQTEPNFTDDKQCHNCIHLGLLKGRAGVCKGHVCLAPITTELPKNSETRAKSPFVYETEVDGICELWTGRKM